MELPCGKRLFGTIERLSEPTLWWKLNNSLPENVEVFFYVRSPSVEIGLSPHERSEEAPLAERTSAMNSPCFLTLSP